MKKGNKLGFMLFDIYLKLGIKHAYALLYFVCIYYLIFDRRAVSVTSEYVKRRFKNAGLLKRILHIYRLMISTGKNLIDLRLLEKKPGQIRFVCNNEPLVKALSKGNGLIIMPAHMGNWQVMMRKLPVFDAETSIVMRPEENSAVSEYLKLDHGSDYKLNMINPEKGFEAVIDIIRELSNGNIVSIMGDRTIADEQSLSVKFFGSEYILPKGPFLIASMTDAPVIVLLTKKNGTCDYTLESHEISLENNFSDKETKIQAIADKYIKIIEEFLQRNPYAWNATDMNQFQ